MTIPSTTPSTTTHYVFLRGINVGGIRVPMPRLREVLAGIGGRDVTTWLATGNVRMDVDVRAHGPDLYWRCPKGATTKSAAGSVLAKARYKAVTTTRNLTTLERMVG